MTLDTRTKALLVFALCAAGLTAAMGWISVRALALERAGAQARAQTRQQERLRLALWRIDSTLSTLLAQESARPFYHYASFFNADRPDAPPGGDALTPSPLLAGPAVSSMPRVIRLYFETAPGGGLASPQRPPDERRDEAARYLESLSLPASKPDEAALALDELGRILTPWKLLAGWPPEETPPAPGAAPSIATRDAGPFGAPAGVEAGARRESVPDAAPPAQGAAFPPTDQEFAVRQQVAQNALRARADPPQTARLAFDHQTSAASPAPSPASSPASSPAQAPQKAKSAEPEAPVTLEHAAEPPAIARPIVDDLASAVPAPSTPPDVGQFRGVWTRSLSGADELMLVRPVRRGPVRTWQGLWLDSAALRRELLALAVDLVPGADLEPVLADADAGGPDRLATIPARLSAPPAPPEPLPWFSPALRTLAVGWAAVIAVLAAVGLMLREAVLLGERRGRFVAAVTHELRTPLTTFSLYSQMLADGMVPTEEARLHYARTLREESSRLTRIVESVLDYARLGRGPRRPADLPARPARELLDAALPALRAAAERAGLTLETDLAAADGTHVRADAASLERILLNLADNAGKYAAETPDRRLILSAATRRARLLIRVRDFGPGIDPADKPKLFSPFHRGKAQHAGDKPGLGLGLALARGIALDLGGDLRLADTPPPGACFELVLPVSRP